MGSAHIKCECGIEQTVYPEFPRRYVLPNGDTLPAASMVVWCRACSRYTAAEDLPTVAEVEEEIALIEAKDEAYLSILPDTPEAHVREQKSVLEWLNGRESPPRCFDCGSTSITWLNLTGEQGEQADHPACGGKAEVIYGLALIRHYPLSYSPEGEKLEGSDAGSTVEV